MSDKNDLIKDIHQEEADLSNWFSQLENYKFPDWQELPDLDLYMDQVVTYLERILCLISVEGEDKLITTWMVNNYVKAGAIPMPKGKKYNKEHLGYILLICAMKQVLSISDIHFLTDLKKHSQLDSSVIYQEIKEVHTRCIQQVATNVIGSLNEINHDTNSQEIKKKLADLAVEYSVEAEAKKIVATKILSQLSKIEEDEKKLKLDIVEKSVEKEKKHKS